MTISLRLAISFIIKAKRVTLGSHSKNFLSQDFFIHMPTTEIDSIHQFEALFNFATIGIVVTNNEGKIINFNKYAETQFGYSKEELTGKPVEILLPDSTHSRHEKYREQYYQHPEPRIMGHGRDLFAKSKDGHTFPVEVSLSHYTIKEQTFVIAFVIDITVRKKHEAMAIQQKNELETITSEIKQMNVELEQKVEDRTKMLREALSELEHSKEELNLAFEKEKELNELKSGFVTVASHEFRTPLTTILSSAYLLDEYNKLHSDPKVEKHIERVRQAVMGMKNILEDFLSIGKMEEGKMQTNIETISPVIIDSILHDLLQDLEGLLKPGQKIDYNNLVTQHILIDRNLLKNILVNLISNAIKFSGENDIIEVRSLIENNDFVFAVSDNGIGISIDDQKHLFERFFRGKNAGNVQGTGLGLHIVGKYLELLKGSITLTSSLNKGTTFTIYLPQIKIA
ncbi:MAG: PAS domain-containing sensor histidine kinase [Ferruginibacter sp.]